MGEQIVSTRGNSSDQGKSKAEVNQPVLPFCFIQILEKLGFSICAQPEKIDCSIMLGSRGDIKNLTSFS